MRGLESNKTKIRHRIFTEIARAAYEGGDIAKEIERLPYKIIPGEVATYRESIFLERAVVGERLRLAMGLPLRTLSEQCELSDGVSESAIAEKYYVPPLINVIKFACNKCPEKRVLVTNGCQGCLEHPCLEVCPKGAISMVGGRSVIDESKCVKCGRCADACSYNAIIKQERPCSAACGMGAIHSDQYGRAEIDQDKCVSCGQCLVSCPFSAISDKGQIYQTIMAIKSGVPVFAAIAPAFIGQLGPRMTTDRIRGAFKALGFADVVEVAIGADICTLQEAQDFLDEVPAKKPFMATSCCPAWAMMAKKMFPTLAENISMALTPMTLTARMIKKNKPGCKVCFIGPCAAKKLEASRRTVRSDVDFVLTFEEVLGMFDAKGIEAEHITDLSPLDQSTGDGRGFAVSGGVARAVVNAIKRIDPGREVKVANANGLPECRKMLQLAKAGKYDGYLLEGMGCPGGCVAGAGTIQSVQKGIQAVGQGVAAADNQCIMDSPYLHYLPLIEERPDPAAER